MKIVNKLISRNFSPKSYRKPITQITFHTVGGKSPQGLFNWFNKKRKNGSSSHYYIHKDGRIERYVSETCVAWCNSVWSSNQRSVTIECWDGGKPNDKKRTDKLYVSAILLAHYLAKRYKIPYKMLSKAEAHTTKKGFTKHKYFANKTCPGALDMGRILRSAKKLSQVVSCDTKLKNCLENVIDEQKMRGVLRKRIDTITTKNTKLQQELSGKVNIINSYKKDLEKAVENYQKQVKISNNFSKEIVKFKAEYEGMESEKISKLEGELIFANETNDKCILKVLDFAEKIKEQKTALKGLHKKIARLQDKKLTLQDIFELIVKYLKSRATSKKGT